MHSDTAIPAWPINQGMMHDAVAERRSRDQPLLGIAHEDFDIAARSIVGQLRVLDDGSVNVRQLGHGPAPQGG